MWSEHTLSLMARFRYCLVAQAEIKHMPAMESASFKYQTQMSLPAGLSAREQTHKQQVDRLNLHKGQGNGALEYAPFA